MLKAFSLFILIESYLILISFAQHLPSPVEDGWNSEVITDKIQEQFYQIVSHTKHGKELGNHVSEKATITSLDSSNLLNLRNDAQVRIQQWSNQSSPIIQSSFQDSFKQFIGLEKDSSELTYKVKVSRIKVTTQGAEARVILFASNPRPDGVFQVNAVMNTIWSNQAEKLLLNSISLLSYDTSLLKSTQPWFKDATAAVFNNDKAFEEQISIGMNGWLNKIERYAGSNIYSRHGMSMGDANGDGLDDIYVCQPGGLPNRLFLKQADGTLKDASAASGLDWLNDTRSALFIDLDNDGDQDIVLGTFVGIYICKNNGNGVFEMATRLEGVERDVSSIVAADYDQDGYVDIYICVYESKARLEGTDTTGHSVYDSRAKGGVNRLFRNLIATDTNQWSFKDVTNDVGLNQANERFSLAAAWEDYDNDGDQDLYIANDFGLNCFYENTNGQFKEVSKALGIQDYSPGMSATWGDINRDGKFDLYVGNMFSSAGNRITRQTKFNTSFQGITNKALNRFNRGNSLYINSSQGFAEEPDALGAQNALWAWSSLLGDIDNDGWQDILCANGYITGPGSGDL